MSEGAHSNSEFENNWTFPLDETYWAFGDGSETAAGVFYGLVLIPEQSVHEAIGILSDIKIKYGSKPQQPIHCRTLFPGNQRAKTGWAHLSRAECATMCGEILQKIQSLSPIYLLSHCPREQFPQRFRLRGKHGHPDLVHAVDAKWMLLWSYIHTAALLDPAVIIPTVDRVQFPRHLNMPFWDVVIKRNDPGPRVSSVYLDRETTQIPWFSKTFQWMSVARLLTIETPKGASFLPIVENELNKHPLVEVADLFIYSVSRELSGMSPIELGGPNAKVLCMVRNGLPIEEMVIGGD